jgi:hypothetical protein
MSYVDNWASEMHEEFGFFSFSDWQKYLEQAGFRIVAGSRPFQNEYIVEKKYKGKAELFEMDKNKNLLKTEYPPTNMIMVGEKP